MSYRNPAWIARNLVAEAGVAAISDNNGDLTTSAKAALIDYHLTDLAVFDAAAADHWIQADLGTAGETWNRLVIPAGHNLDGATVEVLSGATTTPATSRGSVVVSGASLIDLSLTENTDRYVRVTFSTNAAHELGELWIGRYRQLTGDGPAPEFQNGYQSANLVSEFPNREGVVVQAPARRVFTLLHPWTVQSTTDYAITEEVIAIGTGVPHWYYPPDDVDAGPFLVLMTRDVDREQDHPVPQRERSYTLRGWNMLEQVG